MHSSATASPVARPNTQLFILFNPIAPATQRIHSTVLEAKRYAGRIGILPPSRLNGISA